MISSTPERIRVVFSEYGPHVSYAANLAELLDIPLAIYAPVQSECITAWARAAGIAIDTLYLEMLSRISGAVRKHLKDETKTCLTTDIAEPRKRRNDLVVSCDTASYRDELVLSPAGEKFVLRGERGPIFVPLGDGPSGVTALQYALSLARRLRTDIVLWHTTWRNERTRSEIPKDHVCPEASAIIEQAEQLARESGAHFTTDITSVPKVVEGITRAALLANASLIVMAQGGHKEFGTYTDRVRARNCPIPLLIIPKEVP